MAIEIKVPVLPESIADATVLSWYHQPGEPVERDAKLVDLETDKVVLEVVAPAAGSLSNIIKPAGTTVTAEEILAEFEVADAAPASAAAERQAAAESAPTPGAEAEPAPGTKRPPPGPAARRLLQQQQVDPAAVSGTGPKGRITKGDVAAFVAAGGGSNSNSSATPHDPDTDEPEPPPFPDATAHGSDRDTSRTEQRVPMTRLRRRVAERLVEAQQTAAMLTTFNEVDMQAVKTLRAAHRDAFESTHDVKLGFMSFFVKAVIQALRRFPLLNASIDGNDIIYHGYYDVGIAVSTPRGLVVPILRNAEQLSFADIERGIATLAKRARDGQLSIEDLTGGTFSITNGGVFGSLLSTPILNPPQSAILGMHSIQQRPVAIDGAVVIRPMMYLALSYDHRIVDGSEAVQFLVSIKKALEDPGRLLLEV